MRTQASQTGQAPGTVGTSAWTQAPELGTSDALESALGGGRIAIADPDAVPAGIYARQALVRVGLWERLRPRLVPTLDVRAALALVERGEAEAGIVYRSDAVASGTARVAGSLDPRLHEPIVYPLLLLRDGEASRRLYEFLTTPVAVSSFTRRGFDAVGTGSAGPSEDPDPSSLGPRVR